MFLDQYDDCKKAFISGLCSANEDVNLRFIQTNRYQTIIIKQKKIISLRKHISFKRHIYSKETFLIS